MASAWKIDGTVITRVSDGASLETVNLRTPLRRPRPLAKGEVRGERRERKPMPELYKEYVAFINAGGIPDRVLK